MDFVNQVREDLPQTVTTPLSTLAMTLEFGDNTSSWFVDSLSWNSNDSFSASTLFN